MHPVQFISLGPGEADLITLKGLKALQNADCIYCPCTLAAGGAKEEKKNAAPTSRSGTILTTLGIPTSKIAFFQVPMNKNREAARLSYEAVFIQAKQMCSNGKKVAIVAEGDAGFYSSIHYIQDRFAQQGVVAERIPGVPAFIAAGAFAGLHIVKQEEPLLVFPGIVTSGEIKEAVDSGKTVAIMKLSQCEAAVKECVSCNMLFHYFENVGMPDQLYVSDKQVISQLKFPYFSVMIIKPAI
ncbi:MAG: precorrin-2 C(20)-methyltransferase [Bacteroidales bacterium]